MDAYKIATTHTSIAVHTSKEPYILSKEPYILSREPYILSKDPHAKASTSTNSFSVVQVPSTVQQGTAAHTSNEPDILSKEPYILSKEPYILSKEPYILSKDPRANASRGISNAVHSSNTVQQDTAAHTDGMEGGGGENGSGSWGGGGSGGVGIAIHELGGKILVSGVKSGSRYSMYV